MDTIETTAIYEDGILRPLAPLALPEHTQVQVSVRVVAGTSVLEHQQQVDEALVRAGLMLPASAPPHLPAPLSPLRREELARRFAVGQPLSELIADVLFRFVA